MKLREYFDVRPTDGLFGIELEIEGKGLPDVIPDGWRMEHDGSLRGQYPNEAAEYIMEKPRSLATTLKLVKNLTDHLKKWEAKPNFSFRTSLHVHVNCQDMTFEEYSAFLYTSILMERVLMNYCGSSRIGNRFCLRISDAEGYIDTIKMLFNKGWAAFQSGAFNKNQIKYSAINVAPTQQYGSVEFRGMRGTVDREVIGTWVTALSELRKYAVKEGSVKTVHQDFIDSHPLDFFKKVFPSTNEALSYNNVVDDIRLMHSLTIELPYSMKKEEKNLNTHAVKFVNPAPPHPRQIIMDDHMEMMWEAEPAMVEQQRQLRLAQPAILLDAAIGPFDEEFR